MFSDLLPNLSWARCSLCWQLWRLQCRFLQVLWKCQSQDCLSSLPSAPLFTCVYNNTLDTFPGAVFLVQAGLLAISCGVFVHIFITLNRSGRDYRVLVVEQEEDYVVINIFIVILLHMIAGKSCQGREQDYWSIINKCVIFSVFFFMRDFL